MSQPREGDLAKGLVFGNAGSPNIYTKIRPVFFQMPWVQGCNKSDFLTLGLSPKRLYLCQQRRLGWNLPPRDTENELLSLQRRNDIWWCLQEYFQAFLRVPRRFEDLRAHCTPRVTVMRCQTVGWGGLSPRLQRTISKVLIGTPLRTLDSIHRPWKEALSHGVWPNDLWLSSSVAMQQRSCMRGDMTIVVREDSWNIAFDSIYSK